jgi:hypothetical protein
LESAASWRRLNSPSPAWAERYRDPDRPEIYYLGYVQRVDTYYKVRGLPPRKPRPKLSTAPAVVGGAAALAASAAVSACSLALRKFRVSVN